jgi:hypothetical protein
MAAVRSQGAMYGDHLRSIYPCLRFLHCQDLLLPPLPLL